jgi:hypothetical protein
MAFRGVVVDSVYAVKSRDKVKEINVKLALSLTMLRQNSPVSRTRLMQTLQNEKSTLLETFNYKRFNNLFFPLKEK